MIFVCVVIRIPTSDHVLEGELCIGILSFDLGNVYSTERSHHILSIVLARVGNPKYLIGVMDRS